MNVAVGNLKKAWKCVKKKGGIEEKKRYVIERNVED